MTDARTQRSAWGVIPKLPLLLLVFVFGLWLWMRRPDPRLESVARLSIEGPTIELREGTHGSWSVPWPDWPPAKGAPILLVLGVPFARPGEPPPVELWLRSVPADCAVAPSRSPTDEQGWFLAGPTWDWNYLVRLVPGSACAIEYEVRRCAPGAPAQAQLRITGDRDDFLGEAQMAREIFADLGTLFAGFVLVAWLGIIVWRRLAAAQAADAVARTTHAQR